MKLIVGLGNPGSKYAKTRHNAGFMSLEYYARGHNLSFNLDTKLEGEICITRINGEKVILLRPVTFMNESGRSISKVMNYYKIDIEDLLIVYDDMALDVGRLRIRPQGSSGGHNGLKSIIAYLRTQEFKRIRIGIGKNNIDVIDYVLGNFSEADLITLENSFDKIAKAIDLFIDNTAFDKIMNLYNIA